MTDCQLRFDCEFGSTLIVHMASDQFTCKFAADDLYRDSLAELAQVACDLAAERRGGVVHWDGPFMQCWGTCEDSYTWQFVVAEQSTCWWVSTSRGRRALFVEAPSDEICYVIWRALRELRYHYGWSMPYTWGTRFPGQAYESLGGRLSKSGFAVKGHPAARGNSCIARWLYPWFRWPKPMGKRSWLLVGGCASGAGALLHVAIILIGAPAYRYFGAPERLSRLAAAGSPEPGLATGGIAVFLAMSAWYAMSAALAMRPLPRMRTVVACIPAVFFARGWTFLPETVAMAANSHSLPAGQLFYSGGALVTGGILAIGARQMWYTLNRWWS